MQYWNWKAVITGVLCVIGLIGCTSPGRGPLGSDEIIQRKIYRQLNEDDIRGKASVGIRVDQGHVTLYGAVQSRLVRDTILSMVRTTEGVTKISDQMKDF